MLLPALSRAKEKSQGIRCMNNARQMMIAWRMYCEDYTELLVAAKQTAAARVEVNLPAPPENNTKQAQTVEVTVRAEANGQAIGEAKLRVELRKSALPQ